jgi:hypothetical protein
MIGARIGRIRRRFLDHPVHFVLLFFVVSVALDHAATGLDLLLGLSVAEVDLFVVNPHFLHAAWEMPHLFFIFPLSKRSTVEAGQIAQVPLGESLPAGFRWDSSQVHGSV